MEVIKIRLQAQHHSMADPLDVPKYRNAAHALYTIVREEGFRTLYRGLTLTALRQGTNQAGENAAPRPCLPTVCSLVCPSTDLLSPVTVNFTAYTEFRSRLQKLQSVTELPVYQTMAVGLLSGAMGPLSNAPIDTIKTRLQKMPAEPGEGAFQRVSRIAAEMWKQEGSRSFYKGITPRIARVAPGQAVTFTVYEYLKEALERSRDTIPGGKYEE